jgi:hypothetical protein
MLKFVILPLLIILASCEGEGDKASSDRNVGTNKKYEPIEVEGSNLERLKVICHSLAEKESLLNILISTDTEYEYQYAQKGCNDKEMPTPKRVITTLTGNYPNYYFRVRQGDYFGFPEVETVSSGLLSKICQDLRDFGAVKSPMQVASYVVAFTTHTSPKDCKSDKNGYCVKVEKGSFLQNNEYKVHTEEWMKVNIKNPRLGFFTERKLISTANCPQDKTFEKRAVLK